MAKVVWRPEALDELRSIVACVNQFDPAAADRTGDRLYNLGQSLGQFPRRGRPRDDGTREMTNEPPYVLRYVVGGETVDILSVRHGRRRPA